MWRKCHRRVCSSALWASTFCPVKRFLSLPNQDKCQRFQLYTSCCFLRRLPLFFFLMVWMKIVVWIFHIVLQIFKGYFCGIFGSMYISPFICFGSVHPFFVAEEGKIIHYRGRRIMWQHHMYWEYLQIYVRINESRTQSKVSVLSLNRDMWIFVP